MVGTPINQVRRVINQGLIKDLISPLLSVDLWNGERAGKKGGAAGNRTQGLWLSVPVLCHWATTPTSNHASQYSNGEIKSLIRPWLITLRTWLMGVPIIELQAVIVLNIYCTIKNPTQLLSQTIIHDVFTIIWVYTYICACTWVHNICMCTCVVCALVCTR